MIDPHDIARVRRVIDKTPEGRWTFEKAGDSNCGDGCCTEYWDDRVWCDGRVILENSVHDEGVTAFVSTFDRDVAEAVVDLLSIVDRHDVPADVKAQVELIGSMLAQNVSQPFFSDDLVSRKTLADEVSEYERRQDEAARKASVLVDLGVVAPGVPARQLNLPGSTPEWVALTEAQVDLLPDRTPVRVELEGDEAATEGPLHRHRTHSGEVYIYRNDESWWVGMMPAVTVHVHPEHVPTDPDAELVKRAAQIIEGVISTSASWDDYESAARTIISEVREPKS